MPDMRRRTPEPPPAGLPEIQFSPAWRTSCCTSWRRCWPRKASTPRTSTSRPGHTPAGAQPRGRTAQHGHVHPRRPGPGTGSRHHEAHRRGHRRRRHAARRLDLGPGPARVPGWFVGHRLRLRRARARPARPVAERKRHQSPGRPGKADPAACRAPERRTCRPTPHPRAAGDAPSLPSTR